MHANSPHLEGLLVHEHEEDLLRQAQQWRLAEAARSGSRARSRRRRRLAELRNPRSR